jgi:hypothetical protein
MERERGTYKMESGMHRLDLERRWRGTGPSIARTTLEYHVAVHRIKIDEGDNLAILSQEDWTDWDDLGIAVVDPRFDDLLWGLPQVKHRSH